MTKVHLVIRMLTICDFVNTLLTNESTQRKVKHIILTAWLQTGQSNIYSLGLVVFIVWFNWSSSAHFGCCSHTLP